MPSKDDRFLDLISQRRPGKVVDVRAILPERYGRPVRIARPRGASASIATFHHSATDERTGVDGVLESTWDYHIETLKWETGGYALAVDKTGTIYVLASPFADMTYNAGKRWNPITIATVAIGYFHAPRNHEPSPEMLQSLYSIGLSIDDASGLPGGIPWRPHRSIRQTVCPGSILTPHIWLMTGRNFAANPQRPEVYP